MIDPLMDKIAESKRSDIVDHVAAYKDSLHDTSEKHRKLTMTRVGRIIAGCEFASLAAIDAEKVQRFLRSLRQSENLGQGYEFLVTGRARRPPKNGDRMTTLSVLSDQSQ